MPRVHVTSILAVAAACAAAAPPPASAASFRTPLPVMTLKTTQAIGDDTKTRVRVRVIDHGGRANSPSRGANVYNGWGGIEIRGQSSAFFDKKSYGLELRKRSGADRNASLLGLPADADWVLYAAYNDKTLMRNVLAYDASRLMGRWAPRTRFVELVHNGRYEGVYVLMERIELNEARVDVPGKGITGRYLLEFTFDFQARQKGPFFRTPIKRRPIVFEDPERADLSAREVRYIRNHVGGVERTLYRGRRDAWRTVLHPESTVDYVLAQELFRNVDAFHASTFLVKPAGRLLRLGPVWDFDRSTGNSTSPGSAAIGGWWTRDRAWASQLHRDPGFRRAMRARWRELRRAGFRRQLLRRLDRHTRALRPAVGRNFSRWPVLDQIVTPNPVARGSFTAEVRYLRFWLKRRMAWLDRATYFRARASTRPSS